MVFSTRGINHRDRHLMEDIKKLMPHHRPEPKMERTKNLSVVNEMCEMRNCNKSIMFEGRKKQDLYMWISNVPQGPSAKFYVENIHTMAELKLTGNCLRGSRPLLSFDKTFTEKPHYTLLKELLTQTFGVPNHHPKSQPFFDHVYTFTIVDNRIWFRNFQILSDDGAVAEIGPRFVLNPVKIFGGSFGGQTIWENSTYVTPAKYRQMLHKKANNKYLNRIEQKVTAQATKPKVSYDLTPLNDIFVGDPVKTAAKLKKAERQQESQTQILKKAEKVLNGRVKKNKIKKPQIKKTNVKKMKTK